MPSERRAKPCEPQAIFPVSAIVPLDKLFLFLDQRRALRRYDMFLGQVYRIMRWSCESAEQGRSYIEGLTDPQGMWVLIKRPYRHSPCCSWTKASTPMMIKAATTHPAMMFCVMAVTPGELCGLTRPSYCEAAVDQKHKIQRATMSLRA